MTSAPALPLAERDPDVATPTPTATKVLLVATLAVTASAVAVFLANSARWDEPRFVAAVLVVFSVLFLARVVGQIAVFLARPRWLPPAVQWNLLPYRLLLPLQVAILGVVAAIDLSLALERGPLAEPVEALGRALLAFAAVYAGAMVVRYAVRMRRRPEQRWFGGTIPIVFHLVLASFVAVWGTYHVAA